MTILLLKTSDDARKLTKSYTPLETLQGTIKEDCSISEPHILIDIRASIKWTQANYAYIAEFGRYYFIRDMVVINNDIVKLIMHVDVLMSYNGLIKGLFTLVVRQENIHNNYIIDPELLVRTERIISHHQIGTLGNPSSQNIALTVTGGK